MSHLRAEWLRWLPFHRMSTACLDTLIQSAQEVYFAPQEVLVSPAHGVVREVYLLRRGAVSGQREGSLAFSYEMGDLFPVGAALAQRSVTATYVAQGDVFAWALPLSVVQEVAARSPQWADYFRGRMAQSLEDSRRQLQESMSSRALMQGTMEAELGSLPRKQPVMLSGDASVRQALQLMHERRIGSVLIQDADGTLCGIFTRHDVLGRVTLPQLSLDAAVSAVMSHPAHALPVEASVHEAVLMMSRLGVRHVPVMEGSRAVSIVSERDLFALQRLSLKSVSNAIRAASQEPQLIGAGRDIRQLAAHLLAQGLNAQALTDLISHLNDLLHSQVVKVLANRMQMNLRHACWLAFGSQGRGEQTIATDQDNGLIFESDTPDQDRPRWLAFAMAVNELLDACGYPLCKGFIMASNPQCCLTPHEWAQRFEQWMTHGAPQDLLKASIYFDFQPLAGNLELATPLREKITRRAQALPRFLKQMADNALTHRPPLTWLGGLETHQVHGLQVIDLKMQGTALFVDAARLMALAHGVQQVGTRSRLVAVGDALGLSAQETQAWATGFEFLQLLRLRAQIQAESAFGDTLASAEGAHQPNLMAVEQLNHVDRRILKEALRMARQLQQRLEMDYAR